MPILGETKRYLTRGGAVGLLLAFTGMFVALPNVHSDHWDLAIVAFAMPPFAYLIWWLLGPGLDATVVQDRTESIRMSHNKQEVASIFDTTATENFAVHRSPDVSDPAHPLRTSVRRPVNSAGDWATMRSTIAGSGERKAE